MLAATSQPEGGQGLETLQGDLAALSASAARTTAQRRQVANLRPEEPGAVMPPARICEGGGSVSSLPYLDEETTTLAAGGWRFEHRADSRQKLRRLATHRIGAAGDAGHGHPAPGEVAKRRLAQREDRAVEAGKDRFQLLPVRAALHLRVRGVAGVLRLRARQGQGLLEEPLG